MDDLTWQRTVTARTWAALPLTLRDRRDLRSDHAGEHGAVAIYRAILHVTRDAGVRRFARHHLLAESRHLRFFDRLLPAQQKSRLLPIWYAAGWTLGALAAAVGPRAVYATIDAVEGFVELHYGEQIERLERRSELAELVAVLRRFCADEVRHRADAVARRSGQRSIVASVWAAIVGGGSALGVAAAKRF